MGDRVDVEFASDGLTIAGWLYLPDGPGPHRGIVMSGPYGAVRGMVHAWGFPQAFAAAGFATLLFDNPNLGDSGGEPRQELDPLKQQRAYRDGLTFMAARDDVDADRLGIWGSSYSGGHVLVVGAQDRRVKAVVSQAMTISGHANTLRRNSPAAYAELAQQFADDRLKRFRGEPATMIEAVSEDSEGYAKVLSFSADDRRGWRNEITLRSIEMYDEYEPGDWIPRISPRPVLMIVPSADVLTPAEDALAAYSRAHEPKRLVVVPGGHYAVYEDHFATTSGEAIAWFDRYL